MMKKEKMYKKFGMDRSSVKITYTTEMFLSEGTEVTGEFTARLSSNEIEDLQDVSKNYGKSSEAFETHLPNLYKRLQKMAKTAFSIALAKYNYEVYSYIHPEELEGLPYHKRLAHVRSVFDNDPKNNKPIKIENPF